jgi:hypothetical protein
MGTSQLTIARLIIDDWRWRQLPPEFRVQVHRCRMITGTTSTPPCNRGSWATRYTG